jgi:hypothetical protein
MNEYMYGQHSALIAAALVIAMVAAMEAGYRLGARRSGQASDPIRSQVGTVLASLLGLLALLLGFTFSLALQRYEDRSQAVVKEANAIGTAYLRVQLLPGALRPDLEAALREYVDIRVKEGRVQLADRATREVLNRDADRVAAQLWEKAMRAVEKDDRPATSGLFVQALNDLIDAAGAGRAALERHVPEIVHLLLFATIAVTSAILGYASGISGHRVTVPAVALVLLVVCVVYLIIDLDRPRRGSILVSQESMLELQKSMAPAPRR